MTHHEPLKGLGPVDWSEVTQDDLKHFLTSTFFQAQTVIDSIPTPPTQLKLSQTGRARSHTDSSVLASFNTSETSHGGRAHANSTSNGDEASAAASKLQKEWKEVKVPPKDNPMNINVYKLSAKDGRGAWFARRSLHEGIPFDKFKLGLEREFAETMRNNTGPGTGNVRGIGAERKAEHLVCDGVGKAEVWLLSAQFPGPTTPRDFVTLLLTDSGDEKKKGKEPRQFMVVSKPCGHPECSARPGYIRGSYESVEIIREVPLQTTIRRTRSSIDVRREDIQLSPSSDKLGKEEALARSISGLPSCEAQDNADESSSMAVEWIMVTRSDPGGSVPRFMVEKGTPGGIVNDASRFVKWLETKSADDFEDSGDNDFKKEAIESEASTATAPPPASRSAAAAVNHQRHPLNNNLIQDEVPPSGLYSMITGVLGAASSAVASRLPNLYASGPDTDPDGTMDESDSDSDDSDRSFASAPEPDEEAPPPLPDRKTASRADLTSLHSGKSDESSKASVSQHERQLLKLQERYRKLEEKRVRQQERSLQGKKDQGDGDALAKLKEKHEKEIARQEENYRKELKKLEERRIKDEKKAEERKKKELDKEAKNNLSMELERTTVQRDMALKQVDILKEQVGELQAQNTQLVVKLGKLGGLSNVDVELPAKETGTVSGDGETVSRPASLRSK